MMDNLDKILEAHQMWLNDDGGKCANLKHADLSYANLGGANLSYANLKYVDLSHANLNGADLENVDLRGASLENATLSNANLKHADLENSNLKYAQLVDADLPYTDMAGADLRGANLEGADIEGADLRNAIGNMVEIKSIFDGIYPIAYTSEVIQIGGESHTISEWFEFDDARILQMDGKKALTFWRKWKPVLQLIME